MLRGIKGSLIDANEELSEFIKAEALVWDHGKVVKGQRWEDGAAKRSKKHLRLHLLSICSSLDCIAEIIAILLPGGVPRLKLGRAEFTRVEEWLKDERPNLTQIVIPQSLKIRDLYDALHPLIEAQGDEKDWLPLAKMLRNKSAHLGTESFREMGFHDEGLTFYTFLPKIWPLLWEEHIGMTSDLPWKEPASLARLLAPLMRQDKITYLRDLTTEVTLVVDAAAQVLDLAYQDFQDFEMNPASVVELNASVKDYAFQAFATKGDSRP
jgi:hypothetical protein